MSNGYLGNSYLKRSAEAIEYTPEQIKEFMKCAKDPIYFAKSYIKIVHVDRGLVPFDMYDYQKEIANKIFNNRRVAVLTARQSGKTTLVKSVFPKKPYVSLENPDILSFSIEDPRGFLKQYSDKTIIDEFQNAPKLTSYLQGHVDNINKPGMYILTGSNQFQSKASVPSFHFLLQ